MDQHRVIETVTARYSSDPNTLGVMVFGSVARGLADKYSDIDFYVLQRRPPRHSRWGDIIAGQRVDIIVDTIDRALTYLKKDTHSVYRQTSHMIAHGHITYSTTNDLDKLQRRAQHNLTTPTRYTPGEILMHKYSIDDFWGEIQRAHDKRDGIAAGLYTSMLINNIVELTLKLNGHYFHQPQEMAEILNRLDRTLYQNIQTIYSSGTGATKLRALNSLVRRAFKLAGGPLPPKWQA